MEHPGQVYFAYWCVHITHKGLGGVEEEASGCSASWACSCVGEPSVLRKVGLGGSDGWCAFVVILKKSTSGPMENCSNLDEVSAN